MGVATSRKLQELGYRDLYVEGANTADKWKYNPKLLEKILKALALQIGSEVSYNEIAQLIGADKGTVDKILSDKKSLEEQIRKSQDIINTFKKM